MFRSQGAALNLCLPAAAVALNAQRFARDRQPIRRGAQRGCLTWGSVASLGNMVGSRQLERARLRPAGLRP
eukprot:945215-Pyramimonas_sp.AAC.1